MTLQDFQKKIVRTNWYDKYYYYALSLGIIGVSIFFFYDILTNPTKYKDNHLIYYSVFSIFFLLSCRALYLVPNRYKVLSVSSDLTIEQKKILVAALIKELGVSYYNTTDTYFTFRYQRKWWTQDMDVYINVDRENFYVSVIGRTHGRGGFIDFGSAERLRQKTTSMIKRLATEIELPTTNACSHSS